MSAGVALSRWYSSAGSAKRAVSSVRRAWKVSEMYFRKIRPSTRCLYSAASMLARSLSAVAQRVFLMSSIMGGDGRDRTHVDHRLAHAAHWAAGQVPEPSGDAARAKQHRFHVSRVGHHGEDDVGPLGHVTGIHARRGRAFGDGHRQAAAGVHEHLVTGGYQVAGHRRTHDAQADETDLAG
jgi:hypothetical protein